MLEIRTTEADASAKIIVIGVGGAGNKILVVLSLLVSTQISRHYSYVRHRH